MLPRSRFGLSIFIQILLAGHAALAAAELRLVRPASPVVRQRQQKATFEEYERLVKQKVAEMPELAWLWKRRRALMKGTDNIEHRRLWSQVYFAGGGLRSLLHWIDQELSTRSYAEVWKLRPPALSSLILAEADKDILSNLSEVDFKNGYGDAAGWDVLKRDFWDASVEVGGSSIEKVGVNPEEIRDQFGAVRAYYEGRLTYVSASEANFAKYRKTGSKLNQNSRIALVLRHLRFLMLYADGAVTEEDVAELRKIVRSEVPYIKKHNYWIAKSLRKIDQEIRRAGGGTEDILKVLRQTDLFVPLARNGFLLNDKTPLCMYARADEDVDACNAVNIGKQEKARIDHAIAVAEKGLALARDPEVFLALLKAEVPSPSDQYKLALNTLWERHAKAFCALNPSIAQMHRAKASAGYVTGSMAIFRACLHIPRTPAEFIEFTGPGLKSASDDYLNRIRTFWFENVEAFHKLNPSLADVQAAKKVMGGIPSILKLMSLMLPKVKSAEDAFLLVHPAIHDPNQAYLSALHNFWIQIADHAPFDMSSAEFNSFLARIPNETARQRLSARLAKNNGELIDKQLRAAYTPRAILESFSLPRSLHFDQRTKRDILWRDHVERFCRLRPSLEEIAKAKGLIDDVETQIALRKGCLPAVRSAADFLTVMSRGTTHLPDGHATAIAAEWENQVTAFVNFGPTIEEAKTAIAAASPEGQLKLIEAMIPSVTSLDEALVLTTPRLANPPAEYLRRLGRLWQVIAAEVPTLEYRKEAVDKFLNVVQDESAKVAVLAKLMGGRRTKGLLKFMATLGPVAGKDQSVVEGALDRWTEKYCANLRWTDRVAELSESLGAFGAPLARRCLGKTRSFAEVEPLFGFLRSSRGEASLIRAREILEAHAAHLIGLIRERDELAVLEDLVDPLPFTIRRAGIEKFHARMSVRELNVEIAKLARVMTDGDEMHDRELLRAFEIYEEREGDPRARVLLADQFPPPARERAYERLLGRTETLAEGLALIPTLFGDGKSSPERARVLARMLSLATDERDFESLLGGIKHWSTEDRTALFMAVERERSAPLLDVPLLQSLRAKLPEDVFFDYLLIYFFKVDGARRAELVQVLDSGPLAYRVRLAGFLKNARKMTDPKDQSDGAAGAVGAAPPRRTAWWLRALSWLNRNEVRLANDRLNCERLLQAREQMKSEGV